jgi:hypothetical protein
MFLLCAEGLSCLLKFSGHQFLAKVVRVGIHAQWISHLLFADECLVFMQTSDRGASRLKDLLLTYQKGSGQMVNMSKSTTFFSGNCDISVKDIVMQRLDIHTEALGENYLGSPIAVRRSSKDAFESTLGKI